MNKPIAVIVGLVLLLLLLLFSTTYTVKFNEVAIKATFGRTTEDSVVNKPGLHFQAPIFIDKVTKLDTRLQLVESPQEEITTKDGLQLVVTAFLLWRIDTDSETGPLDFYKRYTTIDAANDALLGQFRTTVTGVLSEYGFGDLFGQRSLLAQAEESIKEELLVLDERGIRPVAVGISQIMLPAKTSSAVLRRMEATRDTLSETERTKGQAEAQSIRSEANTKAERIIAFAGQRAEAIRALGEEQAAEYLKEMGEDEDLAIFLSWLDALEQSLGDYTTLILDTQSEPWHLLSPGSVDFKGPIPQPAGAGDGEGRPRSGADAEPSEESGE